MKDLVTVLFVLVLGAGVAGGFFWWKGEQARAADLAYEQSIDEAIDRGIENFQLTPLLATLNDHQGDKVELLRTLYADPIKSDRINLSFGNFQGDWPTTFAHINEVHSRPADRARLAAEVDERFGEGAHALMRGEYEAFLADASANPIAPGSREEYTRGENQWIFSTYLRRNGRYPIAPIRIENRQVVEVIPSDTPTEATP